MMQRMRFLFFVCGALLVGPALLVAQTGFPQRVENRTLNMPVQPPQFGYATQIMFGGLAFTDPVAIRTPPGETNRVFVVEQAGRIAVISNLAAPTRTVFLDIVSRVTSGGERGLLGLAFHPGYATNRYFYVFYTPTTNSAAGTGLHARIARFQASASNPNAAVVGSELPLLTAYDEASNHNGGDLHFGPDGYLYATFGDEGMQNDALNNSQRIDKDFFASIIRIDVDQHPGNLAPNAHPAVTSNYRVPVDNPFVGATNFNGVAVNPAQVRTEIWAVGLRNPWRISFDAFDGTLYAGDVGGGLREEINIIVRGGNYGWAYREGTLAGPKVAQAPQGFTSIAPLYEYAHGSAQNQGYSVTGGLVHRGQRLAQLYGAYVFADYVSGHMWALRRQPSGPPEVEYMLTDAGIAGFGVDPRNGDVLLADQSDDRIKRILHNATQTGAPLPATLAETGVFSNLATLVTYPGIEAYDLNVPFWSDGAYKRRWFSVPETNRFLGFATEGAWSAPTGTVWIKHFELELTNGVPESRRRLETRLLVRNAEGMYGVSYRWGSMLTNALLRGDSPFQESFVVVDGFNVRTQVWHYPSRSECLQCHTASAGWALGFSTRQLNREVDYPGGRTNQIAALAAGGFFSNTVGQVSVLPALAPAAATNISLAYRARSYLEANCAGCHRPGGGAVGLWDARIATPLDLAGIVDGPLNNPRGDPQNRVARRGDVARSMLHIRMTQLGPGRMPPASSSVVDTQGAALLAAWIGEDMLAYQTFTEWQQEVYGGPDKPGAGPDEDEDADGASNWLEYLTGGDPEVKDGWRIGIEQSNGVIRLVYPGVADRGFEAQRRAGMGSEGGWQVLDVPGNQPVFAAESEPQVLEDPTGGTQAVYRVRVFPH